MPAADAVLHEEIPVNRARDRQQGWNHLARNLRVQGSVLQIGPFEDGIGAELITHGGHVSIDGAIAQGD